nr:unnamed protein product [Callosobruchus chinensis]
MICLACGAINTSENNRTFHRFPKDRRLLNIWIATLDLTKEQAKNLNADSYACSDHFSISDFFETPCGQKCLKPGTVPRLVMQPKDEIDSPKEVLTFDDLELEHFRGDIEKAKECWNIVQHTIAHNTKKASVMRRRRLRLIQKLEKLNSIWEQLVDSQNESK